MLDCDFYLHNLVVLVVTNPTSPRLSKTEFVGERYRVFSFGCFFLRGFKKRKEKKGQTGRPGRPQAGTRPGPSGSLPAQRALPDRPRPGPGRPARVPSRPSSLPGRIQAGLPALRAPVPRHPVLPVHFPVVPALRVFSASRCYAVLGGPEVPPFGPVLPALRVFADCVVC